MPNTPAPDARPADEGRPAAPLTVAVLGATGSTGGLVAQTLLRRGHRVRAVSRSPYPVAGGEDRLTSLQGDLTDEAFLRMALGGCDAVVSCLGQNRKTKSLWSKRTSPADILQRVARATVGALGRGSQRRYVYLSAFGVGDDLPKHALLFRLVLRLSAVGDAYPDHAAAERVIEASGTRWTIVRPPGLTDDDAAVPLVDRGDDWSSFESTSMRSVAEFMVSCVEADRFVGRVVTVGEPE